MYKARHTHGHCKALIATTQGNTARCNTTLTWNRLLPTPVTHENQRSTHEVNMKTDGAVCSCRPGRTGVLMQAPYCILGQCASRP